LLAGNNLESRLLLSIVYASNAVQAFSDDDLITLLDKAKQFNETVNITGILLYKDGNFMQVLEGPDEAVLALYQAIQKDRRHSDVTTLLQNPITEREFSQWSMGFRRLDDLPEELQASYTEFLSKDFMDDSYRRRPSRAMVLLETFRDIVR
jgi:hypothetical protein